LLVRIGLEGGRTISKAQPNTLSAVTSRACCRCIIYSIHTSTGRFLQLLSPISLTPVRATILKDQVRDVEILEVAITPALWHGEHKGSGIECTSNQSSRATIKTKGIPCGEKETQQHLKSGDGRAGLWHDEDETFSGGRRISVNSNVTLNLQQSWRFNQILWLRIDSISRIGVGDGGNWLRFLLFLAILPLVVEFDVSLEGRNRWSIIRRPFLEFLLKLCILLLIGRGDNTPASSPGYTSTESDSNPFFGGESCPLHDDTDVVERLALAGNKSAGVGLLQRGVLKDSQSDTGGPLQQGVTRIEVKKVSVSSSRGDTQNVLQRLFIGRPCRQGFDHLYRCIGQVDELGQNLAILAGSIKLWGIPKWQDGTDKLGETFRPGSIRVGFTLCVLVIELEKITLLVQLIGVAVEKRIDRL
jgi:hypothetical protein